MRICMTSRNLTAYESWSMDGPFNLSDGHPRHMPSPEQAAILGRTGSLFGAVWHSRFSDVETAAHESFFGALRQRAAPVGSGRVLSCYSSSVAMDIFARSLRERTDRVALIHPTFDNIPDLFKAWGHTLVPVAEATVDAADTAVFDGDVGCVFVTVPNNPTGWILAPDAMRWLARECRCRGVVLALDTSFRGFDTRMWYDSYEVLDAVGVDYVVIEDSGKLWPTQELKAGFLVCGTDTIRLRDAFSDILLTISPVVLALVGGLAQDAAAGGFQRLHDMIGRNRLLVRQTLGELGFPSPPDPDSRVSVERVALPTGVSAQAAYQALNELGVHVLPCGPFHWAEPSEGESFIRLSLARDTDVLEKALRQIAPRLQVMARQAVTFL